MKLRGRVTNLERKFGRTKPLPPVVLVYEAYGETVEAKYKEYLDRGADPNVQMTYLIYANPPGRPYDETDG